MDSVTLVLIITWNGLILLGLYLSTFLLLLRIFNSVEIDSDKSSASKGMYERWGDH